MRFSGPIVLLLTLAGCASHPTSEDHIHGTRDALKEHSNELVGCYRAYGQNKPVHLKITYKASYTGEVQFADAEVQESWSQKKKYQDCIVDEFKKIRFPATDGGDLVNGTIELSFGNS